MIPEWLPDWRDDSAYPKENSDLQWAWEFLRRNPEYQKDYKTLGSIWSDQIPKWAQKKYHLEKYSAFVDPACPEPINRVRYNNEEGKSLVNYSIIFWGEESGGLNLRDRDGQLSLVFDLNAPIEHQLKNAKRILQYKKLCHNFRARRDKYPTYLRILDAIAAEEKLNVIAEKLFPDIPNEYPDYLGNDQVKKSLKAAKKISEADFAVLGVGAYPGDTVPNRTIVVCRED